jgi:Helix-turn-helix domain
MVSLEVWDKADPLWHVAKGPIFCFLKGYCMARGRTTSLTIRLTPAQRQTLLAWQRSTTIAAGHARRGRIILLMADGVPISAIAATVGISRRFVYKWVQRFLEKGLTGLTDKPGRGSHRMPRQPALAESHVVSA